MWDNNHSILAKYSVFNTLTNRAKVVFTNQLKLKDKEDHIRQALHGCNYLTWALNRLQTKFNHKLSTTQAHNGFDRHPTNNNNNQHQQP